MFKIKYFVSIIIARLFGFKNPKYDLVVVSPLNYEDWILGSIAHKVENACHGKVFFSHSLLKLPSSRAYFFIHHPLLRTAYAFNPVLWSSSVGVWFTHDDKFPFSKSEMSFLLNKVNIIYTPSTVSINSVISEYCIDKKKIHLSVGAADPDVFFPHERVSGTIGMVSRFSERKNPKLMLKIVKQMPDVDFLLIGTRWEKSSIFLQLMNCDNFKYIDPDYSDYHSLYSGIDVYLSTSFLEGGPIPLIETMMSNIVPVVSDTGFARDVIIEGENGFIFNVDDDIKIIIKKLRAALNFNKDVSLSVKNFTWNSLVEKILQTINR